MSRCFPFPPPGYERKHRSEDLDLLKEAKCKEKKAKKEKKVKERKKEKDKERDGSSEKHRDTKDQKEKHKEKKEKHRNKKDKEKYDEAKIKNENKKGSEQDKLKNEGSNNLGGFGGHKSTSVLNGSNSNAINEGNIKRRKEDMCTNGFLHERENRPIKMQRPSPHQLTENGRKLKPPQTLAKPSNANHAILDKNNELVTVGMFEAQKLSTSVPMPDAEASKLAQSDSKMADVIILESLRRSASPHPDSNYLAEVQNVPKNMAEWCENDDDQLWLFSERVERKPELLHSFSDDVCVWSEAVHIKSADICALPYVIPY